MDRKVIKIVIPLNDRSYRLVGLAVCKRFGIRFVGCQCGNAPIGILSPNSGGKKLVFIYSEIHLLKDSAVKPIGIFVFLSWVDVVSRFWIDVGIEWIFEAKIVFGLRPKCPGFRLKAGGS